MSVSYDGKKIIPAPLITINKTYQKTADGSTVGVLYDMSLAGTLLPWKGSPSGNYTDINDAFWILSDYPPDEPVDATDGADFDRLLRKQDALRYLFRTDGQSLEWQPAGGQPVVKCNPRVLGIEFQENQWVDRSNYVVNLETDWIRFNNAPSGEDINVLETSLVQDASESWTFEEVEGSQGTSFTTKHVVKAKGIIGYDENGVSLGPAWQHAKTWVDIYATGSLDPVVLSGALGSTSFIGGSFTKNVSVDEKTGDYSVIESWVVGSDTTYTEKQFSFNRALLTDQFTASYNGTIYGIKEGEAKGGSQAIDNALAAVPTDANARTETLNELGSFFGSLTLGTSPSQKNIGTNHQTGTVTFSFQWTVDEDETAKTICEANLDFSKDTGIYTLRLTCDIAGIGEDSATRLSNSRASMLSTSAALSLALSLVNGSLPGGVTMISTPTSISSSYNDTTGAIRTAYTWTSTNITDPQIVVQTNFPQDVSAQIIIPGRSLGPIVQDMNTQTSKVITVTLTSENNEFKPSNGSTIATMDAFITASSWLLNGDTDSFNENTGRYTRTRTYLILV